MRVDTISRQSAIETALEFFVEFLGGAFHENSQKELIARFQRLPSEQLEFIRCRDCIHAHDHDCPVNWGRNDDDYCSWAEEK